MAQQDNQQYRSLAFTPTWFLAVLSAALVFVSVIVNRLIHMLINWLRKTNQKPYMVAVEKFKEELTLLSIISYCILALSDFGASLCIPSKMHDSFFAPCGVRRRQPRRLNELHPNNCKGQGHEPMFSFQGLEQLHTFIFLLAATHIIYSCLATFLAILKIYSWQKWEEDARLMTSDDYLSHDIRRSILTMCRRNRTPLSSALCFFRHFLWSLGREDYITIRRAFIWNQNLPWNYDFRTYIFNSMEDEFQVIHGLSIPLWGFIITFLLFNVEGSNLYFWISGIPIVLVLVVGTKLQNIIARLTTGSSRIQELRDDIFWFKKPKLLLHLIHYILFQSALQLALFIWLWWQFGYNSCFIHNQYLLYSSLLIGLEIHMVCSYTTLPVYGLVDKMGTSHHSSSMENEEVEEPVSSGTSFHTAQLSFHTALEIEELQPF